MGGIEIHLKEICERLVALGYSIEVFCADSVNSSKYEIINGVRVRRFSSYAPNNAYFFSWRLFKELKKADADLFHIHGYNALTFLLGLMACKKKKCIVTFHNAGTSSKFRHLMYGLYHIIINNLLKKRSLLNICVSESELNIMSKHLSLEPSKTIVLNNGIDVESFKQNYNKFDIKTIVSVGRLEKYKGHQKLIKCLPGLISYFGDVRLKIIGRGPYKEELLRIAKNLRVDQFVEFNFFSMDKRSKYIETLKRSHVFVLMSESEAHPIAVVEALTADLPVILQNSPGLDAFIKNKYAIGVKPGTSEQQELLNQIKKVLVTSENVTKPFKPLSWGDVVLHLSRYYNEVSKC